MTQFSKLSILSLTLALCSVSAFSQTQPPRAAAPAAIAAPSAGALKDGSCEAKAIDKNGKALAGAAKVASIKKCDTDTKALASVKAPAPQASCEAKAIDKNGKALAGAAKAASIKKCDTDTKALASVKAPAPQASCEAKAIDKNGKDLAGAAKAASIKKCTADAAGPAKK